MTHRCSPPYGAGTDIHGDVAVNNMRDCTPVRDGATWSCRCGRRFVARRGDWYPKTNRRRAFQWVLAVAWVFVFAYYFLPAVADLTFTQTLAFASLVVWAVASAMRASAARASARSWRRTCDDAFDVMETLARHGDRRPRPLGMVTFNTEISPEDAKRFRDHFIEARKGGLG